ncbi:hypothetical protein COY14_03060 [Candidatus Roizmanbacteria bacterium CG_4_10_14_0_2_um_filter_36_9]|uniref:Uncharacterized protein n=1 Tax=Candidatus Roizmanbacteria bacterium CG_4_10_14_0_2_um_filter_36_9 TaxID=1974823 RepID=A0A2M7U3L6_9BACT|nr:MAG: hypothetical protein COY14_03060 [Candidatus Roizmanbacteria bacterium CG_4_10_14_0_2_um_filter_36_9]
MNDNIKKLLPKVLWLLLFAAMGGYIVGVKVDSINNIELSGFIIALFAFGFLWAGLVVGYQTKSNEKK